MADTLTERLRQVLPAMPAEDVHAVAAFAEFLAGRRRNQTCDGDRALSDQEHAQMLSLLNGVTSLSVEDGPPVSNRDHDRYLYGGN